MTIAFKYKIVKRPDGSEVKTPSIPITLKGQESIEVIALIDSGADVSAMPKDFAELLGLDLSGKKDFAYGIGGKVESVETKVYVIIKKGHESYNFQIPVKVILDSYDFPVLLGRASFFDKFIISFDQSEHRVSLKKKNKL